MITKGTTDMRDYFGKGSNIRFVFPIDGDCINAREGELFDGGTRIQVTVEAPEGHEVTVCGTPATYENGFYTATAELRAFKNTLCARDLTEGCEQKITVCHFSGADKKYRLFSDDNILFLADINEHKEEYSSIFDNSYLAIYKKAHELYGACVHLNLFYEYIPNEKNFSNHPD